MSGMLPKNKKITFLLKIYILVATVSCPQIKGQNSWYFNAASFFSPSTSNMYVSPAFDPEIAYWRDVNPYFSFGTSAEFWYFSTVNYSQKEPIIKNNSVGFVNLNATFKRDIRSVTPYLGLSFSGVTDFYVPGVGGGIAAGFMFDISPKDAPKTNRLYPFTQFKYIKYSPDLDYLDGYFLQLGISIQLN